MRSPNGYGSISRLPGKRRKPYRVRITEGYETDAEGRTRQIQRTLGTYATYEEAAEALAAYNRNPASLDRNMTFTEIYQRWSAEKYATAKPSLISSYTAAFRAVPMLHDRQFRTLKRNDLQFAVDTCGKNYPTLQNVKILFGFLFRYCVQNDIVDKDYSRFVDIQRHKPEEPAEAKHTDIKPEEIAALWERQEDENVREILMLIYSGLRVGEFLALTPDDVRDGFIIIRGSKTAAGRRRVPIAPKTAPFWADRCRRAISYLIPVGTESDNPRVRYQAYKERFLQTFRDLGLSDHLPHDTRHTTATLLHAAGADPLAVKKILGHSSRDITESVYTHISDDMLREAIAKI